MRTFDRKLWLFIGLLFLASGLHAQQQKEMKSKLRYSSKISYLTWFPENYKKRENRNFLYLFSFMGQEKEVPTFQK
ncbi:MAG: hypothetical protein IPH45_13705 [Bacteroidales bacterium]|nr:hypothetical protein [Bacteroidales bacterium]